MFRQKNWQPPTEYASGVQSMVAGQQARDAIIGTGVSAVGNALLPGVGSALTAVHGLAESALKDEDGLYKNKGAEILGSLDPITSISNGVWGIGQAFQGNWKDIMRGRNAVLKDKIDEEKALKKQADNQAYYGAVDSSAATARPYASGTKQIEIEGREPVFSERGVDGKRTLSFFSPNGNTHAQGGIPFQAQHGQAIVTAHEEKGVQAVRAFLLGKHDKVERIISSMPADEQAPRADTGMKQVRTSQMVNAGVLSPPPPSMFQQAGDFFSQLGQDTMGAGEGLGKLFSSGEASDALTSGAQMAPAIFNLIQGITGKVEKVERRHVRAGNVALTDFSEPQRSENTAALDVGLDNARNLSAGSAGNLRGNQQQAWQDYLTRGAQIEGASAQGRQQTLLFNEQARQQAEATNLQLDNQYDQQDTAAVTAKQNILKQGLTDMSNIALARDKNKQMAARDQQMIELLNQSSERYKIGRDDTGRMTVSFEKPTEAPAELGNVSTQVQALLRAAQGAPATTPTLVTSNTTGSLIGTTPSAIPTPGPMPVTTAASKRAAAKKATTLKSAGRSARTR